MSENFTVQITSRREAIQAAFLLPKILARQSASPVIGLFFFASMAPQPEQHQVGKNAGSPRCGAPGYLLAGDNGRRRQPQTTMAASKKPAARKTRPKGDGAAKERKLTPKQERFVEEYLIDLNATQAAIRAGYSVKTAEDIGRQLLRKTPVAAAITSQRAKVSERAEINAAWVLRQWADIASADPNDLVQYRRSCCRHCWGIGHAYQWTDAEIERERLDAGNKGKPGPDESGGVGFELNREPNPLCPECGGEGRGRMIVADTRKLPPRAKRLYAGVKLGKDGLEIKMRDQDGALANIAKHLGMFPSKVELTGKDGGPVQHQNVSPDLSNLSDDELSNLEAIAAKLGQSPGPGGDTG